MGFLFSRSIPETEANIDLVNEFYDKFNELVYLREEVEKLFPTSHAMVILLKGEQDTCKKAIGEIVADSFTVTDLDPFFYPLPGSRFSDAGVFLKNFSREFRELEMKILSLRAKILAQFHGVEVVHSELHVDHKLANMPNKQRTLMRTVRYHEEENSYLRHLNKSACPYFMENPEDPSQTSDFDIRKIYGYETWEKELGVYRRLFVERSYKDAK